MRFLTLMLLAPFALADPLVRTATGASLTVGGYAEAYYQWNFNDPKNHVTSFRDFDYRHNTFAIDNAALDALGTLGPVSAHVTLQVGDTADAVYSAEPSFRFLQQANLAWTAPLGRGLTLDAGLFLSPIGPETIPIKDNWNWSRSDLFFALPAYHVGFRVSYPFTSRLSAMLHVYNGWNRVVDNNDEKSLAASLIYTIPDRLLYQFLYFTGVERPAGAPEGRAWRHLFDTYLQVTPLPWLSAMAHVDGGFEPNRFGTSGWASTALYLRLRALKWLYFCARGDFFYEWVPPGATPLFFAGSKWVSSGTGTIEFRPYEIISFRVEYRHDQAQAPLYFKDTPPVDLLGNVIPNAHGQDTLTLGATAWF